MQLEFALYNDPWMNNALENFFRILNSLEACSVELTDDSVKLSITNQEEFVKSLTKKILERRQNLIIIEKDRKTGQVKEVKKDHLLLQEEKKANGKVVFKEILYKPEKAFEVVSKIFELKSGKTRCILCGRTFDKAVKSLQQASYPFVTKIASLSGVRSYKDGKVLSLKEYYDNLCPFCYLIGVLEWTDEALIYRTFPGEKSFVFIPLFESLKKLNRFKKFCAYSGILNKTARYSNIRVNPTIDEVENTPGEYSTLLCFYEKFIENVTEYLIATKWAVMQIPFGTVKNVKLNYITINEGILGVIKELKENEEIGKIYSDLIKKIYFFSQNKNGIDWEITREIQEALAKTFLIDNFRSFTKCLLPRKGGYIPFPSETRKGLEKLIFRWRWQKMGVSKENLEVIKSVGNIIAKVSQNNASLLYKLDKVRTINEFWNVLREVARRIPGLDKEILRTIKPKALDEVIQLVKEITEKEKDGWKEVRDLLVVYSAMYYAIEKMPKGGDKNEVH
ncbi:hypothetical protein [Thermodesulfobacterium hydrogeniphilum]|uniref:hypothetical protein n=1 Tax=Thermodesulfobacterium hydrogeniphilum TaxID=161156 RepID=UPI00068F4B5D|nr:hypothetical protein [Thermodesulfobacterium hydrogeniphilum]